MWCLWQKYYMTQSQSAQVSCGAGVLWSSKKQIKTLLVSACKPNMEEWQWLSTPCFEKCCWSYFQLPASNNCVWEWAQAPSQSSDWLFIAQVLLFHCFTKTLRTPWVFWPIKLKRFGFWVISIFTWSSPTTQMHKHFSTFWGPMVLLRPQTDSPMRKEDGLIW